MIPADAPAIHYHMDPRESMEKIEMLEVDRDFFMGFHPWLKPEGVKKIKEIDYSHHDLSRVEYMTKWAGKRFDRWLV